MARKPQTQNQVKPQTEHKKENSSLKRNIVTVLLVLTTIFAGLIAWKSQGNVEKNKVNNYVCKIVGAEMEAGVLAMQCMVK